MIHHCEITVGELFPKNMSAPSEADLSVILQSYGIHEISDIRLIDSTHDEKDIRLNYIIDKKYVLRFCNAPDMTEARLQGLSRLVLRYRALSIVCPRFLPAPDGAYLHPWHSLQYYLSEYIDLPLASEVTIQDEDRLAREVDEHFARFAEKYRDVDLLDTMGMYSLFDLSPFDLESGMDEKEQNFNLLIDQLNSMQRPDVAEKLQKRHQSVRERLRAVYKQLPRCVFQGDENYSNILIDTDQHFRGFIDFNLAGTEVIVNQIANMTGFDYDETHLSPVGAKHRLDFALNYHQRHMETIRRFYHMNALEQSALPLYEWIVMIAQWPTLCFFKKYLADPDLSGEIIELLCLIADLPENAD